MSPILIVRDVIAADGSRMPTQGMFIDSANFARYQAYGWRLPLGAPGIPATISEFDGFDKSPTDVLDWTFDWSPWLQSGEIITASQYLGLPGLTLVEHDPAFTDTTTTVWTAGGTLGVTYLVTNRVSTNQGRQEDWSFSVTITQE